MPSSTCRCIISDLRINSNCASGIVQFKKQKSFWSSILLLVSYDPFANKIKTLKRKECDSSTSISRLQAAYEESVELDKAILFDRVSYNSTNDCFMFLRSLRSSSDYPGCLAWGSDKQALRYPKQHFSMNILSLSILLPSTPMTALHNQMLKYN